MSQADRIRQYILRKCIAPSRVRGESEITIRAGDVHRDIGLRSAMPAVCSVLRGAALQELATVRLLRREGPENGANVFFTYTIGQERLEEQDRARSGEPAPAGHPDGATFPVLERTGLPDFNDAIVLVSCVKLKQTRPAAARDLYVSTWFRKARRIAERSGASWYILSALHGLVPPEEVVAPYEKTLKTLSAGERRIWAQKVFSQLQPRLAGKKRVIFFAGDAYRQHLAEAVRKEGLEIEAPMANLALGEQLAWLSSHA